MYKVTKILDKVASTLEEKGFLVEASEIDVISNTIEAAAGGGLNKLVMALSRDNRTGAYVQTIKAIRADKLGAHPKVMPLIKEYKNLTPREASQRIGDTLGWKVDTGAYRVAKKILTNTDEEASESKEAAAGPSIVGVTTLLMALCSGLARRTGAGDIPAENFSVIELNEILRLLEGKIKETENEEELEIND